MQVAAGLRIVRLRFAHHSPFGFFAFLLRTFALAAAPFSYKGFTLA
jgi:hypothetical protein